MNKKVETKDVFVIGFVLFSMFFGAGNLIFAPFLGALTQNKWWIAAGGFLVTAVLGPYLGTLATIKAGGSVTDLTQRAGVKVGNLVSFLIILCIGPLLAIPRTGATTHEVTLHTLGLSPVITAVLFFGLVIRFSLQTSDLIDNMGKFLTPGLLFMLAAMIVKGVLFALGVSEVNPVAGSELFSLGFVEGYQTMDMMASTVFTGVIASAVLNMGYSEEDTGKITGMAGLIAIVGLGVVYLGLGYLGSTLPLEGVEFERVAILIATMDGLFGGLGRFALGIAMTLACMTTGIGLTIGCAEYFSELTKGKVSYEKFVWGIGIFSGLLSVRGVDEIVALSGPILSLLYPVILTIIFCTLLDKYMKYKMMYYLGVLGAFTFSLTEFFYNMTGSPVLESFMGALPFNQLALGWVVPAVVGVLLGFVLGKAMDLEKNSRVLKRKEQY